MSLYYEAAPLLVAASGSPSSLKSRIFSSKDLKSQTKQVYALVSEAAKWSPVLVDVIEKSQLLQHERKLSPNLGLLLVHDLLLAKKGVAAPASHPLRLTIERHRARLNAEFTKSRLKRGFASLEELRAYVGAGKLQVPDQKAGGPISEGNAIRSATKQWPHPRWARVNPLKTNLEEQMRTTLAGYEVVDSLELFLERSLDTTQYLLHVDKHIPNLLALAPASELSKTSAYLNGHLILQDKASCFPAYLLDPDPRDGHVLDACAAPGNKTTHLASILQDRIIEAPNVKIYACERDPSRALMLGKMVDMAGATDLVNIKAAQDFLRLDPKRAPWDNVGSLLLDPSCSGSGIVARDEALRVVLPAKRGAEHQSKSKKRKRKPTNSSIPPTVEIQEEVPIGESDPLNDLKDRLSALSTFQLKLLLHAFNFPKAHKITYSTCSFYPEENEHVVMKALQSCTAREKGWQILPKHQQVLGIRSWETRGNVQACAELASSEHVELIADACIRCYKGSKEGTQGFFVAAFVREREDDRNRQSLEEDWQGFSDTENRP